MRSAVSRSVVAGLIAFATSMAPAVASAAGMVLFEPQVSYPAANVPLGAHAMASGEGLELVAFVADPDGRSLLRAERSGGDPDALGRGLADELLARGARSLIGG
jgi:hypothetical protein